MEHRKILICLIALLLCFGAGWWLGSRQKVVEIKEEVRYVELPPITKVIEKPVPIKTEPVTIKEVVEVVKEEAMPTDTTANIADFLKRREYNLDFSSDSTGVYKVNAIVEANRLTRASATIIPLQREVEQTVVKVRQFRPYVGGSLSIGVKPGASLEVGILLKDHHFPKVGYQRLGNENYITAGYGYLF